MTTAEKIALVMLYIFERKGAKVTINPPDTPHRAYLLEVSVNVAQQWYVRQADKPTH